MNWTLERLPTRKSWIAAANEFVFSAEKVDAAPLTVSPPLVLAPLVAAEVVGPLALGWALGVAATAAEKSPLQVLGAALTGAADAAW